MRTKDKRICPRAHQVPNPRPKGGALAGGLRWRSLHCPIAAYAVRNSNVVMPFHVSRILPRSENVGQPPVVHSRQQTRAAHRRRTERLQNQFIHEMDALLFVSNDTSGQTQTVALEQHKTFRKSAANRAIDPKRSAALPSRRQKFTSNGSTTAWNILPQTSIFGLPI
jgi:hypothetical protein